MAGRNADGPFRVDAVDDGIPCKVSVHRYTGERSLLDIRSGPVPDLTDAATVGCLLALVREAWRHGAGAEVTTGPYCGGWIVFQPCKGVGFAGLPDIRGHGDTEAEALVAALEAALC